MPTAQFFNRQPCFGLPQKANDLLFAESFSCPISLMVGLDSKVTCYSIRGTSDLVANDLSGFILRLRRWG